MPDLKYVTYCGLYCRNCDIYRTAASRHASALVAALKKDGWENTGRQRMKDFDTFWPALQELARNDREGKCRGCRGGCGDPDCEIMKCAVGRKVAVCSACPEYPCAKVQALARKYPNLIGDGLRQQAVGMDPWIQEQDARHEMGFCFVDLRIPQK